jgi:hypothetical protein
MECQILSTLSFDLTFPTANRFHERFMKIVGEDDGMQHYSMFLIELALVDIRML